MTPQTIDQQGIPAASQVKWMETKKNLFIWAGVNVSFSLFPPGLKAYDATTNIIEKGITFSIISRGKQKKDTVYSN